MSTSLESALLPSTEKHVLAFKRDPPFITRKDCMQASNQTKFIGESTAPRPRKERLRTFESAKGLTLASHPAAPAARVLTRRVGMKIRLVGQWDP